MVEECLSSKRTGGTNRLFETKTTWSGFQVIPLEIKTPSLTFCHTSKHCWKDSSRKPLSSFIKANLMVSTDSKRVFLKML